MTSQHTQATLLGTVRAVDGKGVVHMEDRYSSDIDDLWSALTDPQRLARWIAEVDGDLHLGGAFRASFTSGWEGPGRVDVCEAPNRLLVTMSPGEADETVIEAELTVEGEQTRLMVEERGLPLAEVAAHGAGWQAHIEDLGALLAGREPAEWHARWAELAPPYRELGDRLG
ncbi:MAG: SRPBCC family protein [Jatrophihabitans sp.]